MPDRRTHRGPHPHDAELFAPAMLPRLQEAMRDPAPAGQPGYATSALKLVGDRYDLAVRQ